jgi:RimJ/RimL family protein N-acetyltransferase
LCGFICHNGAIRHTSTLFLNPKKSYSAKARAAISERSRRAILRRISQGLFQSPTKNPAVQPGINDGGFIIEWIGVVPEYRGHGYVADLLVCGMSLPKRAGAEQIRADTHLRNRAMQRAFSRAGFNRSGVRWWYERLARA